MTDWLIDTEDLARLLNSEPDADCVVLDCSWYLPEAGKHAIDDFRMGHIPGAQFVDLADISDPDTPIINMLPQPQVFARVMGTLGIGNDTQVIVYDAGYVSARLWWMFRVFGHDRVKILDGGWRKWKAEGRDIETGDATPAVPRGFVARPVPGRVAGIDRVRQAIDTGDAAVIDARTAARFRGVEGSGYPGVASGAMPGRSTFPGRCSSTQTTISPSSLPSARPRSSPAAGWT